jgi:hypothetical protein
LMPLRFGDVQHTGGPRPAKSLQPSENGIS